MDKFGRNEQIPLRKGKKKTTVEGMNENVQDLKMDIEVIK